MKTFTTSEMEFIPKDPVGDRNEEEEEVRQKPVSPRGVSPDGTGKFKVNVGGRVTFVREMGRNKDNIPKIVCHPGGIGSQV